MPIVWTMEQEQRLMILTKHQKVEEINWDIIAEQFPDKPLSQIKLKFMKLYHQDISNQEHPWGKLEVQQMIDAVKLYKKDYKQIQEKVFPWYTQLRVKNKIYSIQLQMKAGVVQYDGALFDEDAQVQNGNLAQAVKEEETQDDDVLSKIRRILGE